MSVSFTCSAIAVHQPAATFYVAAIPASELAEICRPLSKPADPGLFGRETFDPVPLTEEQMKALVQSLETRSFRSRTFELLSEERGQPYQRFVDETRAVEIARYIQTPSALLPNAIILAVNIGLDETDVLKSSNGTVAIQLPRNPSSAVILDGQHRVASFNYLEQNMRSQFEVVVTFLVGIPFYQQAEIFAIINGKQKAVNKSIIFDLFGYAPIAGAKDEKLYQGLMAVARFCSHVARILNHVPESPWKQQIKMRGPGDAGVISQAAVVEYLSGLVEPKTYSKRTRVLPLLYKFYNDGDAAGCASVIILYLAAVSAAQPKAWSDRQSLFWKNNGVAVLFRLLHDLLLLEGGTTQFMDRFSSTLARWQKADATSLLNPPPTGGGGVQNQLYEHFRSDLFDRRDIERLAVERKKATAQLLLEHALIR